MSATYRLGLFIVAALLAFAAGVFLIGRNELLFGSTYSVKAEFQKVAGLNEGADVRVGGIHEGTVRRIDLPGRPDAQVTVVMDLRNGTRNIIKKDSVASIKSEGLLGDKHVEISFGSVEAERLKDGETIRSEPPLEFSDIFKKSNEILDTTKQAMQNVEGTTNEMKSITTKINQGQGSAGEFVNDKKLYLQARAGITAFQEDMEALKHNFLLRGFFKNRGYEDANALKKHEIQRLPNGPYLKTFAYDAKHLFDKPATAKLKNRKALNQAGKFLEANRFGLAVVTASTGMKGDTDKNLVLTEARALVVREYLVENFALNDTRVKTIGVGKTAEAGDGGRVEIVVYPPGASVPVARR